MINLGFLKNNKFYNITKILICLGFIFIIISKYIGVYIHNVIITIISILFYIIFFIDQVLKNDNNNIIWNTIISIACILGIINAI